MTLISPAYTRDDLIAMINMRDELVSDLKEVCGTRAARIEALERALKQSDEALNQMLIWMPSGFAPQSQDRAMQLANVARKVTRAALAPEQDK